MKRLVVLALVAAAGWGAYQHWFAKPPPPPPPPPLAQPVVAPKVNFAIRGEVKALIDEWEKLALQEQTGLGAQGVRKSMGKKVLSIKKKLFSDGKHDEASLRNVMVQAACEMGHSAQESELLVGGILGASQSPGLR